MSFEGTTLTYEHNHSNTTYDQFTYTVSDGEFTVTGTVNVVVIPQQDGVLYASDDILIIDSDSGEHTIPVLNNDTIENPDGIVTLANTDSSLLDASFGHISTDGNIVNYTPDEGFVGLDFFEYKVTDNIGQTDVAFVIVDVRYESVTRNLSTQTMYVNEGDFGRLNLMDNIDEFDLSDIKDFDIDFSPQYGLSVVDLRGNLSYHANETYDNDRFLWFRRNGLCLRYKVTLNNDDVYYGKVKIYVDSVDKLSLGDDVKTVYEGSENNPIYVLRNDYIDEPIFYYGRFVWFGQVNGPLYGSVEKR